MICDSSVEPTTSEALRRRSAPAPVPLDLGLIQDKVLGGERITSEEALQLYRGLTLPELGALADAVRQRKHPERVVTYIIDRNINYTNVCNVYCTFCAFMREERDDDSYVLTKEQVGEKIAELVAIGGVQILMQGGHHPKLGLDYYLDLLRYIRRNFPQVNIHGFSPPEFTHFAGVFGLPLEEVLRRFKDAGLGSIPGGGGEILVDRVRRRIAPLKCTSDEWLRVMEIAHGLGLNSSATMMFGHVEAIEDRIEHLGRLRELQDRTHGFTAFICWTFQAEHTRLRVPMVGAHEYLRTQALARIFLDNFENVQSSWVTQGPQIGQIALGYGANDFGSVMMEENVVSQAGATFRIDEETIKRLIAELGYEPRRRNNWYQLLN
ncbi:MAG TPA: cyclic dehypoxanthinyl futalosine synthase [Verrucomicrobiae bacterium]|nr:cyclic dehypoxanthinyl futalosine synthase [Verrucomicrobiae bacterium]